jgi:F-type H+-transporting ATPase subunit gamma
LANIRTIRRRIRGIQSIAKVTRAMEMIAASKMRRAQERGLAGRPYAEKIAQVLADLAALPREDSREYPLLEVRQPVNKIALVHITPDRGLTGGLVSNINRKSAGFILDQGVPVAVIPVGRKGIDFMHRTGQQVVAEFAQLGDRPGLLDALPIARVIIEEFTSRRVDAVYIAYTRFVTTMTQSPVVQRLLPVATAAQEAGPVADYLFEPDAAGVLGALLPRFVEMQIYHAILESIASEQSARMIAMRNATDSAQELVDDLTLVYNKARQESITRDLLDIAGGVAALK